MTDKKNKKSGLFGVLKCIAPKIIKAAPFLFIAYCIITALGGLLNGVQTLALQKFFDRATEFAGGNAILSDVIYALIILALAFVLTTVLSFLSSIVPIRLGQKSSIALSEEYYKKIASLAPITFEDTENLDTIEKASAGRGHALSLVIHSLCYMFFFNIPYFAFMAWYLFSMKPLLALAIILAFVPKLLSNIIFMKMSDKTEDTIAPERRQNSYYSSCIMSPKYFKETRLLGAYNYFITLYKDTLHHMEELRMKLKVKRNIIMLLFDIAALAGYVLVLLILFESLMNGTVSIGAFAAVYNSIGQIYSFMENFTGNIIYSLSDGLPLASNFAELLKMPDYNGKDVDIPEKCNISVNNISFAYPHAERNALSNVSFDVKGGETIAIVGENGSGKSTLIKLITGFYRPDKGSVEYNGMSSNEISFSSISKHFSAVFQRYAHYSMTLADNLIIGQIDKEPSEEEMRRVCSMAGFSPEAPWLPDGFDTMLSRDYGGVAISGGQIQRIAIARAFYRDCNIIILDEPTAAIDPFEEARIYNRFAQLSKGKTSFIVTHRLGSVKLADRIIVMKEGYLAEMGTHEELMKNNGEYKKMYLAQSQWYKDEETA